MARRALVTAVALVIVASCSPDADPPGPPSTTEGPDGPSTPEARDEGVRVVVDLSARHQVMDGFGVSARVFTDPHLAGSPRVEVPPEARDTILRSLFTELGLTRLRSILEPGLEPENDNNDPGRLDETRLNYGGKRADEHIALVRAAQRWGLQTFFGAPLTTEPWMGVGEVDEYVEWAIAQLRRWRALGAEPAFYSPLNERSARGERSQEWYVAVVRKLGERIRAEGFDTKLVVSDDLNARTTYGTAAAVLADPAARPHVGALAYHLYGGDDEDRRRMAALGARYRLPVWMTEYSSRKYDSWPGVIDWATRMSDLITEDNVSAIDYLWGFFGSQGQSLISMEFVAGRFTRSVQRPPYAVLGQFSRFVGPGAVRVATTSSGPIAASAYAGPDDDQLVVVLVNRGGAVHVTVEVQGGAIDGAVRATAATESATGAGPSTVVAADGFEASLEPASVTTFVMRAPQNRGS